MRGMARGVVLKGWLYSLPGGVGIEWRRASQPTLHLPRVPGAEAPYNGCGFGSLRLSGLELAVG